MNDFHSIPLSVDDLLLKSREIAGVDLVDEAAIEPLAVLCQSINDEASLSEKGAPDIQHFIMRSLVNRLRMLRDFTAHPEIAEQKIKAPIVVCGATRTGSTKTQKLLAASGDFNWLPFWQSLNPSLVSGDRSESTEKRIQDANEYVRWFDKASPSMKHIHVLDAHEPEEESFILAHSLRSPVITGMVEAPSFIQWLMAQNMSPQFSFLKDTLKYLQWQGLADPKKRWVLKSPFYAGLEPLLLKIFPDANLVMTHRHPKEIIPSTCSLFTCYRQPYTDVKINAQAVVAGASYPMNMHLAVREDFPGITFLDINYKELLQPVATVAKKIYRFCDQPLSEASRQRIINWDNKNPKHKKGVHKYSLQEFGLTDDMVNQPYSEYINFIEKKFN